MCRKAVRSLQDKQPDICACFCDHGTFSKTFFFRQAFGYEAGRAHDERIRERGNVSCIALTTQLDIDCSKHLQNPHGTTVLVKIPYCTEPGEGDESARILVEVHVSILPMQPARNRSSHCPSTDCFLSGRTAAEWTCHLAKPVAQELVAADLHFATVQGQGWFQL